MNFLLISRAPIDGYPPMQYQATLLAEDGHRVSIVTTRMEGVPDGSGLGEGHRRVPGLSICRVRARSTSRLLRVLDALRFATAILKSRWRLRRSEFIEISFDPDGVWFSDVVPLRPSRRVAHLHEALDERSRYEKRLSKALPNWEMVVVPDQERARITQERLGLAERPLTVENYPLIDGPPEPRSREWCAGGFEVVYCGSIGLDQELEPLIESVMLWEEPARLTLIGNKKTLVARQLRKRVEDLGLQHRIHFTGWMERSEAEALLASSDLGHSMLERTKINWITSLGASNKRYQLMKAGIPQLSDCNPGVRDLIEGNQVGRCLDQVTPEAIAEVVNWYARHPERCEKEGRRARRLFEDQFNYQAVFPRVLEKLGVHSRPRESEGTRSMRAGSSSHSEPRFDSYE